MGLTIHYDLGADVDADGARSLVARLRESALAMDCFPSVGSLCEAGPGIAADEDTEHTRLCGIHFVEPPNMKHWLDHVAVPPIHVVMFSVETPAGSDSLQIGLATHPPRYKARNSGRTVVLPVAKQRRYTWHYFCKTLYASLPDHGGTPNFLRAHLGVVALLDRARELGLLLAVNDEGSYWESRDEHRLLAAMEESNLGVAGLAGAFLDALPEHLRAGVHAPILSRPDFEHLEAQARRRNASRPSEDGSSEAPP